MTGEERTKAKLIIDGVKAVDIPLAMRCLVHRGVRRLGLAGAKGGAAHQSARDRGLYPVRKSLSVGDEIWSRMCARQKCHCKRQSIFEVGFKPLIHQHVSYPYDPQTGEAKLFLRP